MTYEIKGGPRDGEHVKYLDSNLHRRVGDHIRIRRVQSAFTDIFLITDEGVLEPTE